MRELVTIRRSRMGAVLSLLLLSALSGAASGQPTDFGFGDTLGIQELAVQSPSAVFRPLDMLGVRAGAKAWAMGGTYVGRAEGLDAVAWNPAGLGWLARPELAVDSRWIRCSGTTKDYPDTLNLERIGQPNLLVTRYEVNLSDAFKGNLAGGAYSIEALGGRRVTGALSFRRYLDVAYPERVTSDMVLAEGGFPITFAIENKEEGGVDAAAATFACQVMPGLLSVGINLNFLDGRLSGTKETMTSGGGQGTIATTSTKFNYKGRAIDLGLQARQEGSIPFSVGLRYTPAYTVEVTGGQIHYFSTALGPTYPPIDFTSTIAGYDMEVPPLLSIGASVKPVRYLNVAIEWDRQNWGETKISYRDDGFAATQLEPELPLRNTSSFHAGMELRYLKLKQIDLPVRFGFYSGPLSMANLETATEFYDYAYAGKPIEKDIKSSGLTMGLGFETGQIRYDFTYDILDYTLRRFYFDDPAQYPPASILNPTRAIVRIDPRRVATIRMTASLAL
jgi:hypothetical protein